MLNLHIRLLSDIEIACDCLIFVAQQETFAIDHNHSEMKTKSQPSTHHAIGREAKKTRVVNRVGPKIKLEHAAEALFLPSSSHLSYGGFCAEKSPVGVPNDDKDTRLEN